MKKEPGVTYRKTSTGFETKELFLPKGSEREVETRIMEKKNPTFTKISQMLSLQQTMEQAHCKITNLT